jgi:hypothetical protein
MGVVVEVNVNNLVNLANVGWNDDGTITTIEVNLLRFA